MMQIIEITDSLPEQSIADALACPETRTAIDVFESIERALYLPPSILSRRALNALQKRFETIAMRLERRHAHDLTSIQMAEALVLEAYAQYLSRLARRADQ